MSPPEGLSAPGRSAWKAALVALAAIAEDPEHSRGALTLYCGAVDTLHVVRRAWVADGRPALSTGASGQLVAHPALASIRDQERHVANLAENARAHAEGAGVDPSRRRASCRIRDGARSSSHAPCRERGGPMSVTDEQRIEACRTIGLPDALAPRLRGGSVAQLIEDAQALADETGVTRSGFAFTSPEAAFDAMMRDREQWKSRIFG